MAKSQAESQSIFKGISKQINDLGYEQVLKVDEDNAKSLIKAREDIVKQFADKNSE